jgi:protein Hikeshi
MACFGLIISGRLVQTDFQQIDETKFLINIPEADNINYLVAFLTGSSPLPLGSAGAVYWSWPDANAPSKWQYLGYISNQKPSAIFKISQLKKLHELETHENLMQFGGLGDISHIAQVGISIEPEQNVISQTSSINNEVAGYFDFGKKMLENFMNFVTSFTTTQSQMVVNPSETYVPLSTVTTWFNNFQRRLEQNPNFWK